MKKSGATKCMPVVVVLAPPRAVHVILYVGCLDVCPPFLFVHSRNVCVVDQLIIQPDGTREFFLYNKVRVFMAAEEYDEDRLVKGGDNAFM